MHESSPHEGRRDRVRLGKLLIDRVGLPEVTARANDALARHELYHIVTANLQFLSIARRNPVFADVANNAELVVADGRPLLWMARLGRTAIPERITGHDLLYHFCEVAAREGRSVFFLGAGPGVAEQASDMLRMRYPGLRVAGYHGGRYTAEGVGATPEDEENALAAIRAARPDYVFVCLGCPKQEFWISRHRHQIGSAVYIGVGGVLDVLTGKRKRAPQWMQRVGFEWLYRLMQEPRRLWRRYLLQDVPTVLSVSLSELLSGKRPP